MTERTIEFIRSNARFFKRHADWFEKNWHVVRAFEARTLDEIQAGRTHISARDVVGYLSSSTAAREVDGDYKIGNDNACDLARVFCVMNPHHADIWEMRRRGKEEFLAAVRELEAVAA